MRILEKLSARNRNAYAERPVTIVCLGDSVTHGCFELVYTQTGGIDTTYRPEEGYAAILESRLRYLFPAAAATVINAGISGDSAKGGLSRLNRDVLSYRPDLVTVNYALNDAMNADVEAGLQAYRANMRAILEKLRAAGAEVIVVTPNDMCHYASKNLDETMRGIANDVARVANAGTLDRYVEAERELAREFHLPVADAYQRWQALRNAGVDTTMLLKNGINHPAVEMHALFVEKILDAIFNG